LSQTCIAWGAKPLAATPAVLLYGAMLNLSKARHKPIPNHAHKRCAHCSHDRGRAAARRRFSTRQVVQEEFNAIVFDLITSWFWPETCCEV
jgi:hypothetical protein